MMRMDGAGLVQNDVFAKALRIKIELRSFKSSEHINE